MLGGCGSVRHAGAAIRSGVRYMIGGFVAVADQVEHVRRLNRAADADAAATADAATRGGGYEQRAVASSSVGAETTTPAAKRRASPRARPLSSRLRRSRQPTPAGGFERPGWAAQGQRLHRREEVARGDAGVRFGQLPAGGTSTRRAVRSTASARASGSASRSRRRHPRGNLCGKQT